MSSGASGRPAGDAGAGAGASRRGEDEGRANGGAPGVDGSGRGEHRVSARRKIGDGVNQGQGSGRGIGRLSNRLRSPSDSRAEAKGLPVSGRAQGSSAARGANPGEDGRGHGSVPKGREFRTRATGEGTGDEEPLPFFESRECCGGCKRHGSHRVKKKKTIFRSLSVILFMFSARV